ncbi:hypothetical protein [Lysobacter enzymogenes]|uniref:hypothetical protein n=1 Tax=Lysobacter enzymogenes TaxID=69 RepID=UPI000F4BF1A6|nr:hypothetical protein [Lysobacter enzymogenes]
MSDSDTVATGYDSFNRLTRYRSIGNSYVHTYTSSYVGWEGFQESSVTGAGRVQPRREGTIKNGAFGQDGPGGPGKYLLVHAGRQQLAELKQGYAVSGPKQPLYYTDQIVSLGGLGNSDVGAGNQVAALPGETLLMLAQRGYGDGQLCYVIAEYVIAEVNGLGDPNQELAEGLLLTVPSVTVSRNSAETFKPYSPGEAIGSTTPGLPFIPPPPKEGCGAFAKVLMVAIAVAVSIATYGAMTTATTGIMGSIGAGLAAGAASSFASQTFGLITGVVDSFSWKDLAVSAVSNAATAGFGKAAEAGKVGDALAGSKHLRAAASAVAGNVASYGVNKLVGNEASFSWTSLAVSAVAGGVGSWAGDQLVGALGISGDFAERFTRGITGGLISAELNKAVFGRSPDYSLVAADAIASAMAGSMIAKEGARRSAASQLDSDAEGWRFPSGFTMGTGLNFVNEPESWRSFGGFGSGTGLSFASASPPAVTQRMPKDMRAITSAGLGYVGSPKGLQDHINTTAESLEVSRIVRAAVAGGVTPPDSRSYPMVKAYEDAGYQNPHRIDAVQVYAAPEKFTENLLVDSLLNSGRGWGVLNQTAITGNASRNRAWPTYRAPRPVTWMGTGSAGAWRDMKTAQANYSLGPLAAPIGYLGGAAKASYEPTEFLFSAGSTLGGSVAFVTTGGVLGANDFVRSTETVTSGGKLLWNMLGEAANYHSFGLIGKQEHKAFAGYMGVAQQGFLSVADGTIEAWSRGEYLQAGGVAGSILGLPMPVTEAAVAIRALESIDDIIGAAGKTRGINVVNAELTIASNAATGNPAAISRGFGTLNSRQASVLEQLPEFGSSAIIHKSFGQRDLAALTAATGDEFAMFSTGGRRLVFRGNFGSVPITPDMASELASQGWRWSSHTHPGYEVGVLRSSPGDQAVLGAMGGKQSAIFNSMGQRGIFTPDGDSLNGWKPWL